MRLILRFLAKANVRWASADLHRSDRLRRDANEALDAAALRLHLAQGFVDRATEAKADPWSGVIAGFGVLAGACAALALAVLAMLLGMLSSL